MSGRTRWERTGAGLLGASMLLLGPAPAPAQTPAPGEVRQLVTFHFLPGRAGDALRIYEDQLLPLYRATPAMRSFRVLREAESPVPLDLIVVSAFDGMAGMDASNEGLRAQAEAAGTSIGALYGAISALTQGHTDEFVAMEPDLGRGDPGQARLTALVRYAVVPGARGSFEALLRDRVLPLEEQMAIPSATGRFLIADGWDLIRWVGFESLGEFQAWMEALDRDGVGASLRAHTVRSSQAILVPLEPLSVRED